MPPNLYATLYDVLVVIHQDPNCIRRTDPGTMNREALCARLNALIRRAEILRDGLPKSLDSQKPSIKLAVKRASELADMVHTTPKHGDAALSEAYNALAQSLIQIRPYLQPVYKPVAELSDTAAANEYKKLTGKSSPRAWFTRKRNQYGLPFWTEAELLRLAFDNRKNEPADDSDKRREPRKRVASTSQNCRKCKRNKTAVTRGKNRGLCRVCAARLIGN